MGVFCFSLFWLCVCWREAVCVIAWLCVGVIGCVNRVAFERVCLCVCVCACVIGCVSGCLVVYLFVCLVVCVCLRVGLVACLRVAYLSG